MAIGLKGNISGYDFKSNDVNGQFGTNATATGIDIDPNKYTCAIPMKKGETPFQLGDVIMVSKGDKSILVLATDVGGLPHADIDLVDGVATKALGTALKRNDNGVGYLEGDNANKDYNITLVGNIDYKDKKVLAEVEQELISINRGEADIATLQNNFRSRTSNEFNLNQRLASLAPSLPQQTPFGRSYNEQDPKAPRRDQQDLLAYILGANVPMEDKLFLGLIVLALGMLSGMSVDQMFSSFGQMFGMGSPGSSPDSIGSVGRGGSHEQRRYRSQDISDKDAPAEWNMLWKMNPADPKYRETAIAVAKQLTPDAFEAVRRDPTGKLVVQQEVRGTADKSYALQVFTDSNGVIQCMPVSTGGAGNGAMPGSATGTGSNMHDPRYPKQDAIPDYTVTNFRFRAAKDGLGEFTVDYLSQGKDMIGNTGRGAIRGHVGAGALAGRGNGTTSLGCNHYSPEHNDYIKAELQAKLNQGDQTLRILPSRDNTNVLVREIARTRPEQLVAHISEAQRNEARAAAQAAAATQPAPEFDYVEDKGQGSNSPAAAKVSTYDGPINPAYRAAVQAEQSKVRQDSSPIDYAGLDDKAFDARRQVLNKVAEIKAANPGKQFVVIDSGHGTHGDCGASCNGYNEDDVIRSYTPKLKAQLESKGYVVVETDTLLPDNWGGGKHAGMFERTVRKEIAGQLGASAFVSVHADAASVSEKGTSVYYYGDSALANKINDAMGGHDVRPDTRTRPQELGVLRTNKEIPSALVELINMKSPVDVARLNDKNAWAKWTDEKAAQAANAIDQHIQSVAPAQQKGQVAATEATTPPLTVNLPDKPRNLTPAEIAALEDKRPAPVGKVSDAEIAAAQQKMPDTSVRPAAKPVADDNGYKTFDGDFKAAWDSIPEAERAAALSKLKLSNVALSNGKFAVGVSALEEALSVARDKEAAAEAVKELYYAGQIDKEKEFAATVISPAIDAAVKTAKADKETKKEAKDTETAKLDVDAVNKFLKDQGKAPATADTSVAAKNLAITEANKQIALS